MSANVQDYFGCTPLMSAVMMDDVATASLLIEQGADPGLQDENGETALKIAEELGKSPDLIALLRRASGE